MVELYKVHDGGPVPEAAVIFLHGLGGDAFSTWSLDPKSPPSCWPYWLEEDLPGFAVYSIGYEASKTNWRGVHALPISDRATSIYGYLQPYLKTGEVLHGLPLIFITHSLGGLVAKSMLRKAFDDPKRWDCDLLAQTKGVVFIATPHAGSKAAGWADLSRIVSRPSAAVRDMLPDDAGLRDLNNWFRSNAERQGVRSRAFYETKDTSGIEVVDVTSADPAIDGLAATPIDANHIDIAKPVSRTAPLYVQVVDFLKGIQASIGGDGPDDGQRYQSRRMNAFPTCADLHVKVEPSSDEVLLSARAILRCSRERLRSDHGWVFKLAPKSLLLTLSADGGKVSEYRGFGDGEETKDCQIVRGPHDGFTLLPKDDAPLLQGLVLDDALLPTVHASEGRSCTLIVQIGAFPEDLDIAEVVEPDGTRMNDLGAIRQGLVKVVVSRALNRQPINHERLDRVSDQIVLSQAHLSTAASPGSAGDDPMDIPAKDPIDWDAIGLMLAHPNDDFAELAEVAGLDPATDFVRADLRLIDFGGSDLAGFNFEGANLQGADFSRAENIERANLRSIKGKPIWRASVEAAEANTDYHAEPEATAFGGFESAPFQLAEDQAHFEPSFPALDIDPRSSSIDDLPPPPAGWTWIDRASLEAFRQPLSDDELGRFFDGLVPGWHHILSDRVPKRDVVIEAAALLQGAAFDLGRPRAVFLEGAGGEGKSTAFLQTVATLLDDDPSWRVLWRRNDFESIGLPTEFLDELPKDGRPILIATDEAQNIARNLLTFVEKARAQDVGGLHVLIAARDTDFQERRLRGVSEADAGRIIDAWSRAGKAGSLAGMGREEAVRRFVQVARDEERKFGEGALLGAMIELRMAEGFRPYVKSLLRRLDGIRAPGGSLGHAYSYIAAMHAENLRFLSSSVLAHRLGCDETTLRKDVIRPLADEAAGQSQGDFVLTRHRRIAEMAMEILEQEEGENRFDLLIKLAGSSMRAFLERAQVPAIKSWNYEIRNHLIRLGRQTEAVSLTLQFCEIDPTDIYFLISHARTLRETGNAQAAVDLLREKLATLKPGRDFYYEWGTAAGNAGDHALNVWLAGVSLSDADGLPRLDAQQVKLSLAGLGVACKELYAANGDKRFLRARGAAGQLGLRIPGIERDARTSGYFRRHRDEAEEEGIEAMSVDAAVQAVEDAVLRAFDRSDVAEDLADEGVPYRDEIYFKSLGEFPWRRD